MRRLEVTGINVWRRRLKSGHVEAGSRLDQGLKGGPIEDPNGSSPHSDDRGPRPPGHSPMLDLASPAPSSHLIEWLGLMMAKRDLWQFVLARPVRFAKQVRPALSGLADPMNVESDQEAGQSGLS